MIESEIIAKEIIMGFFKTVLSLIGWGFLAMAILNVPAFHKIIGRLILTVLPGLLLASAVPLFPDRIWLDILVWLGIMVLIMIPLSFLPRIQCACVIMSTFFPAYYAVWIVVNKIIPLLFKEFETTFWTTVIIWGLSFLATFLALVVFKDDINLMELKRKWLIIPDRIMASIIVTISILVPMIQYSDKIGLFILAGVIGTVIFYFLNVLLYDWYCKTDFDPPPTEEERAAMARREARREKRRNSIPAKVARGTFRGVVGVAKFGLGTLYVGGQVVSGVANLLGADMPNPIPKPDAIIDPYAQMEQDYYNYEYPRILQEEYEQNRKDSEAAARKYYEENYR